MNDDQIEEDLDRLLSHDRLSWLFGAGSSCASGLPLMDGLTARVLIILEEAGETIENEAGEAVPKAEFCSSILAEVGPHSTVEQLLDQVADYLAIALRAHNHLATTSWGKFRNDRLAELRLNILRAIRDTVSAGYRHHADPALREIGTREATIVSIEHHLEFLEALFGEVRAGRPRTQCVDIFSLNYDTLFEDALGLSGLAYSDGFVGGAVAYWDPSHFQTDINCVRVMKLHGSIDWTTFQNRRIVRRRIADRYPDQGSDLLIYPQASKYEFSRREPYDTLFQRFRERLERVDGQVLAVCGYGFGDSHVNAHIEDAMAKPDAGLTLVIFSKALTPVLEIWRSGSFGERVYVLCEDAIYRGKDRYRVAPDGHPYDWWTFEGTTKRLRNVRLASGTL